MLFLFFASLHIAGSYCEHSPDCYVQSSRECDRDSEMRRAPETPEELLKFCQSGLSQKQCVVQRFDECVKSSGVEEPYSIDNTRKMVRFLQSNCKEDSQIFKVVSTHLKCVTSVFKNSPGICYGSWEILNETRQEELVRLAGVPDELCVFRAWAIHCFVAKFKVDCGGDVRDAVSKAFEETDMFHSKPDCPSLTFYEDVFTDVFSKDTEGQEFSTKVFEAIQSKAQ